jgi:hypothetical protein
VGELRRSRWFFDNPRQSKFSVTKGVKMIAYMLNIELELSVPYCLRRKMPSAISDQLLKDDDVFFKRLLGHLKLAVDV